VKKLEEEWHGLWSNPDEVVEAFTAIPDEIRCFTEHIRSLSPEPQKPSKKTPQNPYFIDYLRGIQYARPTVLRMAKLIGDAMEHVRGVKIAACRAVNEQQPYVRKSKWWEGITKCHGGYKNYIDSVPDGSTTKRKYEPLMKWSHSPHSFKGEMNQEQAHLVKEMQHAIIARRKELFHQQPENPGYMSLGSSFTLAPISPLSRAFVDIDRDTLTVWRCHYMKEHGIKRKKEDVLPRRTWWVGFFDPYRSEVLEERKRLKGTPHKFRCIRRSARKKVEVRYLARSRRMMYDESKYTAALLDTNVPVPLFVSSVKTDGVQVKLVLKTLAEHHPTARHTDLLVKKGYNEIKAAKDRKLDIFKDTRGVYDESRVSKVSKERQRLLRENQQDIHCEMKTIDPGLVEMVTWASTNALVEPTTLAHSPESFGSIRSSRYRSMSLSTHASKWEQKRRQGNTAYRCALDALSQERLNHDSAALVSYIRRRNEHKAVLEEELLDTERSRQRFIYFRAQQRALRHLARQIAGRNPIAAEKKSEARMRRKAESCPSQASAIEARLKLREKLRAQVGRLRLSVVVFGKGVFGHGRVGPCPRKKLIKKLSELTVVILIDEYRTSKMCCGACGCEAHQLKGSRVLRCQSGKKTIEGVSP
jgi:hypothetical protein